MSKAPAPLGPTGYTPSLQPDGAVGLTAQKPELCASSHHSHPAPQPPPGAEGQTFCPTADNKLGEAETTKVYGTFKNAAPAVPGSVAFRKDSCGSTGALLGGSTSASQGRGTAVHYGDPLRSDTDQNNASSNWTAMSQTTIILGTDGNTSVQPVALVSDRERVSRRISLRLDHPEPVQAEQVYSGFDLAFTRVRLNVVLLCGKLSSCSK